MLWINTNLKYVKDKVEKIEEKYVNELPYEGCLVNKRFLSQTVLETIGSPDWLPRSYDVSTEFEAFLGEFLYN